MREDIIERGENPEDYPILSSRPDLYSDLYWIWEAFSTLSGSRQTGFSGPQNLTIQEMLAYCEYRGYDDEDERDEFFHLIQHLDRIFMEDFAAKSKSNNKGKK